MTPKEQLISELENVDDPLIAEVLDFLRFLKTKQTEDNEDIADARHVLATVQTAGTTSWETLKPRQTLAQRRGGHPKNLLQDASPETSLRENRKGIILEHIQSHHHKSK